jgi:alpha-ketoglutarate-dependent taurine dioxygenase
LITEVSETKDGLLVKFDRGIARLGETDHEMLIDWKLLKELSNDRERAFDSLYTIPQVQARAGVHYWDAHSLPSRVRHYDFEDFKAQKEEFWEAMSDMVRLGIVFIKNVPKDPNSVVEIANAMGPIKETFYGRTFDVQAKPNADNVAYTSEYLGLHQDLLYLHETPQVQLLHCMENSCAGGESLFADAERVLKLLKTHVRQGGPLSTLKSEEIKYGYHKHGQNYTRRKPVFQEHPLDEGEFTNMYWSPPFQDIDEWSGVRLEEWIPAARIVEDLINHKEAVYTHRLQPGECVIFDNLRVLHGRRAFDAAGGSRWLRGTYLAPDAYLSKITQIPKDIEAKSRAAADIAVGDRPKGAVTWPSYRDKLLKKMLSEYPHIFTPASDKASSKVADHPVKLEYPRILSAARNETALEEAESYAKQQVERLKSGGPRVSSSASGEAAPRDGTDKDKNEEIERLREELRKFRVDVDKFSKGKGKDSSW